MGCWNETCWISKLPIRVGDEAYALFYFQLEEINKVFLPPLIGEYDDYGFLEEDNSFMENPQNKFVLDYINRNISKFLFKEEYKEIYPKLPKFDSLRRFNEYVQRRELKYNPAFYHEQFLIKNALVRKDVVDELCTHKYYPIMIDLIKKDFEATKKLDVFQEALCKKVNLIPLALNAATRIKNVLFGGNQGFCFRSIR